MLMLKIAWRNIFRHQGKSLVIGGILFFGAFLLTVGNGIISGMDKGLRKNIVNSVTGDIVIISDKQESDNVFMNFMGRSIEPIMNFPAIKKVLSAEASAIDKWLPAGKNMAMIINEFEGEMGASFILGFDFGEYRKMFPHSLKLVEGSMFDNRERGVLLPTGGRDEMIGSMNVWFIPQGCSLVVAHLPEKEQKSVSALNLQDSMVFMGYSENNSSSDVRLGIGGVVKYAALNKIWGNFVIMDIESYRHTLGYFTAGATSNAASGANKQLLSLESENLDDFFGEESLIVEDTGVAVFTRAEEQEVPEPKKVVSVEELEAGAYNMVFVLLKKGVDRAEVLKRLNEEFKQKQLGVRAVSWEKATGTIGSMASIIKLALFVFVSFLFFVAIIIIVNTLSMAAIERTTEIGMMRAVGARKGFIARMFVAETGMLSTVFGGAGIVVGAVVIKIVALFAITTDRDMVQLLFGGDTFLPLLTMPDIVVAIVELALVTIIAVVYPVKVARGITPLDAISRD